LGRRASESGGAADGGVRGGGILDEILLAAEREGKELLASDGGEKGGVHRIWQRAMLPFICRSRGREDGESATLPQNFSTFLTTLLRVHDLDDLGFFRCDELSACFLPHTAFVFCWKIVSNFFVWGIWFGTVIF
jgi:hypothetical protein